MSAAARRERERLASRRPSRAGAAGRTRIRRSSGTLRKRLEGPFALIVQGFLAGALLFFTIHPFAEPAPDPSGGGAMLSIAQA